MIPLEICIDANDLLNTERDVAVAYEGGATTIELCTQLHVQGLTPSAQTIAIARKAFGERRGLMVMIRPRDGLFVYTPCEVKLMRDQIIMAANAGADGVVLGLLNPQNELDAQPTAELVNLAKGLKLTTTFHRAFDDILHDKQDDALDALLKMRLNRLLTCGAPLKFNLTALQGLQQIQHILKRVSDRMTVVLAGGINITNISALLHVIKNNLPPMSLVVHMHSGVIDSITGRISLQKIRTIKSYLDDVE
jgi:copper homeostasis protein